MKRVFFVMLIFFFPLVYFAALLPGAEAIAQSYYTCERYKIRKTVNGYQARFSISNSHELKGAMSWDFGDGSSGGDLPLTHTYSSSGSYTVRATIYRIHYWPCHPSTTVEIPGFSGGRQGSRSFKATSSPRPLVQTCQTLPDSIQVKTTSLSTQCQQVGAAGIGVQSVIDNGFIDAVDVWGGLGDGVEVCFRGSGSLILLDTATSPRAQMTLSSYSRDDMICAELDRLGIVVLVPTAETAPAADTAPGPVIASGSITNLENCYVTTTHILNFRDEPGGRIIERIPYNITLTALARAADWFKVDLHGVKGWISAEYVLTIGACAQTGRLDTAAPAITAPSSFTTSGPVTTLENCTVTLTHILNFRDGPGGSIIKPIPYNITLSANARTADWFKVDLHGEQGWISADYVLTRGDCG